MYKVPLNAANAEFIEKKSRFISHVSPLSSEAEALAFIKSVREKHNEASHNVYAYRIKDNNICRHSDDGEPSGTAGIPLLEAFLKQDIFDFCCVATRYFGGIKLGAGGLVRAYSRCGAAALEASGVCAKREVMLCSVLLPYPQYDAVKRIINASGAEITSEDFGTAVEMRFVMLSEDLGTLRERVRESTAGSVNISVKEKTSIPFCK